MICTQVGYARAMMEYSDYSFSVSILGITVLAE